MIDAYAGLRTERYGYPGDCERMLTPSKQIFEYRFRVSEIVTLIYECFFKRFKVKWRCDIKFLDKINPVFICFVAPVIQHCLKAWKNGMEPTELVDFTYETGAGRNSIVRWEGEN